MRKKEIMMMVVVRSTYVVLVGKPEGRKPL
jgi:hypothetical protein